MEEQEHAYFVSCIRKILGNITAIGETNYDKQSLINLKEYEKLAFWVVDAIGNTINEQNSYLISVNELNKNKCEILERLKQRIDEILELD